MPIDPYAEARRLLDGVDPDLRNELAEDPAAVMELLIDGLTITNRAPQPAGPGCAIDGSYNPGPPPRISVALGVTAARQRFTLLHELGHHLIEVDGPLNDDLSLTDTERRDEAICNEVAASVLLPDDVVEKHLPAGSFAAKDVARLYEVSPASRMACCVAAARRLHRPGCVILGRADGVADFTAHHPATGWRVARGTPQGDDSVLARAARSVSGGVRMITCVRFAAGNRSGDVHADAFSCPDGWVFAVIVDDTHAPWGTGLHLGITDTGPVVDQVECIHCGEPVKVWGRPCRRCGDHTCPRCRRCSCPQGPPQRVCSTCGYLKAPNLFPDGGDRCIDCE